MSFCEILLSQKKFKEGDKVLWYDKSENLTQIEFLDTINGQTRHIFNVQQSNPYRISNDSLSHEVKVKNEHSSLFSFYVGKKFIVICYEYFDGIKKQNGVSKGKAICYVVDNNGKIIHSLPQNEVGYNNPVITNDGKYVGVLYGTSDPHTAPGSKAVTGFKIYDVTKKNFILNLNIPIGGPVVVDDKIIVTINHGNDKTYYVYVPAKRICYLKTYSRAERNGVQFQSFGFIIKNEIGMDVFENYASFFEMILF